VVDTWCFSTEDLTEFMSMEHMHSTIRRLWPRRTTGCTNRRRPILTLVEDTTASRDTAIAACDNYRFGLLAAK
jgi:hypothetical protein